MYVSSYYYTCVLILLCMWPHTTICVSSYYYEFWIRVRESFVTLEGSVIPLLANGARDHMNMIAKREERRER